MTVTAADWLAHGPISRLAPKDELVDPYRQIVTANAAMDAIARNVAAAPLDVWTGPPSDTEREPAKGRDADDAREFLASPHPELTGRDLKKLITLNTLGGGEGWLILRDDASNLIEDPKVRPSFAWPARKDEVAKIVDGGFFRGWRYQTSPLPAGAFVQVKDVDPRDPLRGLGKLEVAAIALGTDWGAQIFSNATYKNGAIPGGYVTTQASLGRVQRNSLREQLEQRHGGARNASKVAVFDNGMEFKTLQATHESLEHLAQRTFLMREILMAFRTPESEVGLTAETKYSNGLTGSRGWWASAILPTMAEIEEALNGPRRGLGQRFGGVYVGFDYGMIEAFLNAVTEKLEQADKLIAHGVPPADAYAFIGLRVPRFEGDDVPMVPAGVQPLAAAIAGPPPAPAKPKGISVHVRAPADPLTRAMDARDRIDRVVAKRVPRAQKAIRGVLLGIRRAQLELLDAIEPEEKGRSPGDVNANDVVLDPTAHELAAVDAMTPEFIAAVSEAADTVASELGHDLLFFEQQHPQVTAFVQVKASKLREPVRAVVTRLEGIVREGVAKNQTVAELKRAVKDQMNVELSRASAIARTEVGESVNGGRFVTMRIEGVERHEWSTFFDGETRDTHRSIDGEIRRVGSRFSNGLRYPQDVQGPASEVVNCRCVALALPDDEPDEETEE